MNDETFVKIIIICHNLVDRFLSGFYGDLFNNKCYNIVDISFIYYLNFLYYCFFNIIKNINNLNVYFCINQKICYDNCSNLLFSTTNNENLFHTYKDKNMDLRIFWNLKM